jgi:hypothetical protein
MTGNAKGVMEFDPGEADTGEAYVTALVLPDTAESIKAGTTGITGMLFRNFRSLKSIRGDNIVTVGAFAFGSNITSQKNTALTTAEFPRAESIGRYAFAYHTALTSLNLESAITLESQVFRGCTALRELNLPHAETIGNEAFRNCTALETLYVPKAVSLGMGLFQGTSTAKALTITLGSPAPSLGDLMFGGGSGIVTETVGNKKVTVRIPTGAEGYDTAWKDKFKTGLSGNKTPPAYEEYTPEEE